MNLSDLKYTVSSTSSLSYGSFLKEEDLKFYSEGLTSKNFPFGKSETDYINFGVYNLDETSVTSSMFYAHPSYESYTRSFYDVFNQYTEYSYKQYTGDFVILGTTTQSLFLDVSKHLNALNVQDGNYKLYIELGRNIIGSEKTPDDKLIINKISNSRNEISIIPKNIKGSIEKINKDYDIFSKGQIRPSEIIDDLMFGISKPEFYNIYQSAAKIDPNGSAELMFNYSFKRDVDVVFFLNDIYYGVKKGNYRSNGQIATNDILGIYDQFKNWMYQNYNSGKTFQDIRNYYYSLFVYIADHELNRITNKKPDSYDKILQFLQSIFYDAVFFPYIFNIEAKHNIDLSGYFKYYLNFEDGTRISIVNRKVVAATDPRFYDELTLKLLTPLPVSIISGTNVWITCDFGFLPIVQNLYYFSKPVINTIPLRGPNFLIKIENEGNSTQALSMEQLLQETGSLYDELHSKIHAKKTEWIDTTDYRHFENFVNFSSANLRLQAFESKRDNIEKLYIEIEDINQSLLSNPSDTFYLQQKADKNSEIDAIESGMDGYEKFLYTNPAWYEEHNKDFDGYTSASYYDKHNGGSLINNLPQFMIEDADNNSDYIKFVGMVGHFFDNISLAAKQYTEKNNYSSSPNYGISLDVVGNMLKSLGWDAEISKENLPLILSAFSKDDFDPDSPLYDKARSLSEEQRNQIIWKRILNTLPFIYKTKGTEASLNALISCFGVPKNIIKIKEYGGIQNIRDLTDKSLYIIEDVKYEPYFSGSGEYFKLDWTGSSQTIEFNLRFDTRKLHDDGKVFRLINCSDIWAIGAVRERGKDWGSMFFSLDDGAGNIKTILTDRAPIFDGNSYHIMLRRNDVDVLFGATASINEYPTRYDLMVQKSEDDRITYEVDQSMFVSGSYNDAFESGSYLYIGNYNQNTASLSIDPEAFFGNIDDIRIWEGEVSNERFASHTLNRNAYDLTDPRAMISENLYRISFERPVDLFGGSEYIVQLNNLSFRRDFPTFDAVNFPVVIGPMEKNAYCDPSEGILFPYQFSRKDVRYTMNLPDYGSNKFRSNKINYIEQELVSELSSDTRVSRKMSELSPIDSNKLGIFFSPAEMQNSEIIKFFGEFPMGDLIGDPSDVYKKSYDKFERFKQIYYDQGFGNIDFTFFMNIVRFYFDKAMFKYIKGIIPARAKLVDGILIEPSILERPKLDIKPAKTENIPQKTGVVDSTKGINAQNLQQHTASVFLNFERGMTVYNDVNQSYFDSDFSEFGFGVYANNGLAFYNQKYYRCDVVKVQKKYSVLRDQVLDYNTLPENLNTEFNRKYQTIEKSYEKINLVDLPKTREYPMTASMWTVPDISAGQVPASIYFKGKISFNIGYLGWKDEYVYSSHTIDGLVNGSFFEKLSSTVHAYGTINSPMSASGSYNPNPSNPVIFSGLFNLDENNNPIFEGTISTGYYTTTAVGPEYYLTVFASSDYDSIFSEFVDKTSGPMFARLTQGVNYQKSVSDSYKPADAIPLDGYFHTHYKYKKQQFSRKEINSIDATGRTSKWKKSSQNKKTTVSPVNGLLDNTEAVESKTI